MAHTHTHEDHSSYYLEQLCTLGIAGLLGGVSILLWYHGILRFMLNPKFFGPVLWGGIALLVLAVLRAATLLATWGRSTGGHHHHDDEPGPCHVHGDCHEHEPGHEHVHAHDPNHEHDHGHEHGWNPWRYVVLLLPVVLYFLDLPNQGFSGDYLRNQGVHAGDVEAGVVGKLVTGLGLRLVKNPQRNLIQIVDVTQEGPAAKANLRPEDFITKIRELGGNDQRPTGPQAISTKDLSVEQAAAKLKGEPGTKVELTVEGTDGASRRVELTRSAQVIPLAFKELEQAAYTPALRQFYQGKIGQLRGQFMPGPNDRTFSLVRVKITCCAADAVPINVMILIDPNAPHGIRGIKEMTWVVVSGEIQFRKRKDRDEYVPVLLVASPQDVHETDPDPNPYLQ